MCVYCTLYYVYLCVGACSIYVRMVHMYVYVLYCSLMCV